MSLGNTEFQIVHTLGTNNKSVKGLVFNLKAIIKLNYMSNGQATMGHQLLVNSHKVHAIHMCCDVHICDHTDYVWENWSYSLKSISLYVKTTLMHYPETPST